jgi:hypothetical protein
MQIGPPLLITVTHELSIKVVLPGSDHPNELAHLGKPDMNWGMEIDIRKTGRLSRAAVERLEEYLQYERR